MGMFDHYEPVPPIELDGDVLSGWQGKSGPCVLYVWRQGSASPIIQAVDEEVKGKPEIMAACRLPEGILQIYTTHPKDSRWIKAEIQILNGVWIKTVLLKDKKT